MTHPCRYSPEVLELLNGLIAPGDIIHDPFAGTGERLGHLCDQIGAVYTGTDLEDWPESDSRVKVGDSTDPATYPQDPFIIVTSPVYQNKRFADYANGPLPGTKTKGRRDYGIALGRALHPNNLARWTGRGSRAKEYYDRHGKIVVNWGDRAIVNVDLPIAKPWADLLKDYGFTIRAALPVYTQRYRGLANSEKRASHEMILVAVK